MRYIATIFFLCAFTLSGVAQIKQKDDKRTQEEKEFDIKNYKGEPNDRLIIEINRTGFLNQPSAIKMSWRSIGMNVALMFDKPIGHSNFSVGYGIGFYSHNFHSNADFVYRYDSLKNHTVTDMIPKTTNYTVNRFAQKFLEIPLELRFRTKTRTKFKTMIGGKFGYVVNDFRTVFDDKGKVRFYNTKNLNNLRYGVVFRIGVEHICLTASYYFSEVFVKNRGVNGMLPYSVGIAIIPF